MNHAMWYMVVLEHLPTSLARCHVIAVLRSPAFNHLVFSIISLDGERDGEHAVTRSDQLEDATDFLLLHLNKQEEKEG